MARSTNPKESAVNKARASTLIRHGVFNKLPEDDLGVLKIIRLQDVLAKVAVLDQSSEVLVDVFRIDSLPLFRQVAALETDLFK